MRAQAHLRRQRRAFATVLTGTVERTRRTSQTYESRGLFGRYACNEDSSLIWGVHCVRKLPSGQ